MQQRGRDNLLSKRQRQIVALIAGGCANSEIAERLKITVNTVKHCLVSIFDRTGCWSRLELCSWAHGNREKWQSKTGE
jgi:DNA-binding NarL/FixJ family response regulator